MPKLEHYEVENHCYFVTTTTEGRRAVFADEANAQILCNLLYNLRARGRLHLVGFVIMPDHFHLLVVPREQASLSWIMQEVKKSSAKLVNRRSGRTGKVWLDEYYETAVHSEPQLLAALQYIHGNPIAAGLVEQAEEYAYSSANHRFENDLALALGLLVGVETTPTTEERTLGTSAKDEAPALVGVETPPTTEERTLGTSAKDAAPTLVVVETTPTTNEGTLGTSAKDAAPTLVVVETPPTTEERTLGTSAKDAAPTLVGVETTPTRRPLYSSRGRLDPDGERLHPPATIHPSTQTPDLERATNLPELGARKQ